MSSRPSPSPTPMGWYPWYVAGFLSLALAFSIMDRYLMSIVVEPVKKSFALSDTELGLLTGASFVILYVTASIPLGRLADIANRRMIIFCGILAWSAATISCGLASSFWELFGARMAVGLGEAALMPAAMSLLSAYFSKETRSRGMAIYALGNSMGRAAAFIGGGYLLGVLTLAGGFAIGGLGHFAPWQAIFVIAGSFGLLVAALGLTIREPQRSEPGKRRDFSGSIGYFWSNRGVYLRFFLTFGMVLAVTMAMGTWMVSTYVRKFGLSVGEASIIVGATSFLVGPIGAWCGGWLTDRLIIRGVRSAPLLVMAGLLIFVPIGGLVLSMSSSLYVTFGAYMLVYFCMSAAGPPGFNGVQLVTPEPHRGLVSSLFQASFTILGSGLGPLVVGILSDRLFTSGSGLAGALSMSFLLFSVVGIVSALYQREKFQHLVDQVSR